jgi:hypothetical protein
MMPDLSPDAGPAGTTPHQGEGAIVNEPDTDTQADELLVEQIEEAQDSAT